MSKSNIRFSTDILRRLGEELNPSPDRGILELVKNSYDADAINCTVELINTEIPGGTVRIVDDGDGMNQTEIINGWLVLGQSGKDPKRITRLGRNPAGSKGLGRLAALRMGQYVSLETIPRKDKSSRYSLLIDWKDYAKVKLVEDVPLTIKKSKASSPKDPGVVIEISNLRSPVSKNDVKCLARELVLLADPFRDNPQGFKPVLRAPEFSDMEKLVQNRYFEDAEYHLHAKLDQNGRASAAVLDYLGKVLFTCGHEDFRNNKDDTPPFECPPMEFDFWVFLLNRATFASRQDSIREVRSWLKHFGGVHLYHNGLRVTPYGNPGHDWLEINVRRAQSPEERPSTNTSIGRVSLHDHEAILLQKTDRSGFIESKAFHELKAFAQEAMEWMARERLRQAEKRRNAEKKAAPKKSEKSKKALEEIVTDKVASETTKEAILHAVSTYERTRDREVNQLKKEIQLYRTLSTAGITAATFAHESTGNPIKVIAFSIRAVQSLAKKLLGELYSKKLQEPIDGIIAASKSLDVLGAYTLGLVKQKKRRHGRIEIHGIIKNILKSFAPFLEGRDVKIETRFCNGNPYLKTSHAAVESIITNLLNNSLLALEAVVGHQRIIRLTTELESDVLVLRVADNGPGIRNISKRDIWLPGHTTRLDGTGLGLTIVRDTVFDLTGEVDVIEQCDIGGAELIVRLPILGV